MSDKKVVHYYKDINNVIVLGARAWIVVADHPNFPDATEVMTSTVLNHNTVTGEFETLNTMYKPYGITAGKH